MKKNTYCTLVDCPFKDCEHYWEQLKHMPPGRKVSIANLYGICRRYIGWLAEHQEVMTDDTIRSDSSGLR